jgi:bla regulator protein blaR1
MAAQLAVLAILLALLAQPSQQAQAGKPAFEVATIRRNTSVEPAFSIGAQPGGRFRVVGMDVRTLIRIAYRSGASLFPSQIIGGPAWMAADAYDITAKAPDAAIDGPAAEVIAKRAAMLQSLLEDRFKLKVHRETREVTEYALVLARKDGSLGPQMRRSSINCTADITRCETRSLPGQLTSTNMTAAGLASYLASVAVQTVVIDRTGLSGMFALTLEWTPDGSDKPMLFTAIQDQLGLKLEPERAPADVVVVDHIERPAED